MKTLALLLTTAALLAHSASAETLRTSLAMFESGATSPKKSSADQMRGAAGEVSRFQIMPEVWREYSVSNDYANPEISWDITRKILDDRIRRFQTITQRSPRPIEIYLLWNKPGHFEQASYDVQKVRPLYRERAQRFENLHLSLTATAPTTVAGAQ